jgi:glutaredoxin
MGISKERRDKIFAKAGTKNHPLLFIDDEFVGDYPRVFALEGEGALDAMLNY